MNNNASVRQSDVTFDGPLLVDTREAARLLGVSSRTVWRLYASQELPIVRIGRAVRFDVADLRKLIEQLKSH